MFHKNDQQITKILKKQYHKNDPKKSIKRRLTKIHKKQSHKNEIHKKSTKIKLTKIHKMRLTKNLQKETQKIVSWSTKMRLTKLSLTKMIHKNPKNESHQKIPHK